MDFTSTNLEAAILDQKVAGAFHGKTYAFVAVTNPDGRNADAWMLGVAVKGESGFNPIKGKYFRHRHEATEWAGGLNRHIGLTGDQEMDIVASSMRRA